MENLEKSFLAFWLSNWSNLSIYYFSCGSYGS